MNERPIYKNVNLIICVKPYIVLNIQCVKRVIHLFTVKLIA